MPPSRKARIAHAFDRADDYASHATIQRIVAQRLAEKIRALPIDPASPALEIGCGTGFLTSALVQDWPALSLTVSDVAPAMLSRARAQIGERSNLTYALIDGERLDAASGRFGLIASSLAFQWFDHPREAVERIVEALKPGGWLAFATFDAGSFREWADAQRQAGLEGLTRTYADAAIFETVAPGRCGVSIDRYTLAETHRDGLDFLRGLKAIGASASWREGRPAAPAELRRALRLFEDGGAAISYEIAEVLIRRNE